MGKTGKSTTLNSFGTTKQEIESKKDLLEIFCCLAFFSPCGNERVRKAKGDEDRKKTETANKFLNPPNVSVEGKCATEWRDYRESINKILQAHRTDIDMAESQKILLLHS